MKIFHLNNPASGNRNGHKLFPQINHKIKSHGFEHHSVQTEYPGHGTKIIEDLDLGKYDTLLVSGGDGSLFEALNGYLKNKNDKKIPLAIVPVGRGNAFARDIDLTPNNWQLGIDFLKGGKTKKVDIGKFKTCGEEYHFVNILGFGFVTDVAGTAYKFRALGHLSYLLGIFHRTAALKSYSLKMEIDGVVFERENVFTEISNSRYTGKDFLMAPNASIHDGFLDVVLLNKLSRTRLMQCLPKIFKGTHVEMDEVETFKAKKIKIETSEKKLLTPDGQLMGSTPIEVECLHHAIEIYTG